MRLIKIKPISVLNDHINDYPTPLVGYSGSFGFLTGVCLFIQIFTGVFLAIYYTPDVTLAFLSVEFIIRNVNDGWLFRYIHSTGASIFFICIYLHIYVNFQSDADDIVWYSGVTLYVLAIATAFVGYTLPWGQISYWGAIVITNAVASVPYIGTFIVQLIWGGFSIANPTLTRFFTLHIVLPFIMFGVILLHLSMLHTDDSSGSDDDEYASFSQFYIIRDLCVLSAFITVYLYFVFFKPNYFTNPNNYIPATITSTPRHLVPEWYFLPFYAVLRCTPDKFGGLILIIIILVDIFLLESSTDEADSAFFWSLINESNYYSRPPGTFSLENEIDVGVFIVLGFLGHRGIEEPYTDMAAALSLINYFGKCRFTFEIDEFE